MSIMKIVYTQEKCEFRGDGSPVLYMGEESWSENAFKIAFFLLILSMVTDFIDFIKKLP